MYSLQSLRLIAESVTRLFVNICCTFWPGKPTESSHLVILTQADATSLFIKCGYNNIINHPFGNGNHTTYKTSDLGDGLWHCYTHITYFFRVFTAVSSCPPGLSCSNWNLYHRRTPCGPPMSQISSMSGVIWSANWSEVCLICGT